MFVMHVFEMTKYTHNDTCICQCHYYDYGISENIEYIAQSKILFVPNIIYVHIYNI